MIYLLVVSIIWSLSFGLIKTNLTSIDPNLVAFLRLLLSMIIFLPFLKIRQITTKRKLQLITIGMIQYGVMYLCYINAFQYLQAYQIAVFTVFTPIYINLINDIWCRKFHSFHLNTSFLAVIGSLVIVYQSSDYKNILIGFLLIQLSNLSFAFGQTAYKKIKVLLLNVKDKNLFSLLYLGSLIIILPFIFFSKSAGTFKITPIQGFTLLYLGVIASGLCFYLWNVGVTKTRISKIAIMNNLKIPLAVLFSLIFFGEQANLLKLIIGLTLILYALYLEDSESH